MHVPSREPGGTTASGRTDGRGARLSRVPAPTDAPSLAELIAALREPSAYPHPVPDPVEVRQTHISTVFLAA